MSNTTLKKLPSEVRVLGVKFRIEVADQLLDDDGTQLCGQTDGELRSIRISEHQDTRRRWTTLLHECLHAALYVNGVAAKMSDELEEVIVQSLEHSLEEFFLQYGKEYVQALSVQKYPDSEKRPEVQK